MGYLSASIEWSNNRGTPDAWKAWWYDPAARVYYFVGKDNIPFHTVIWPAELLGVGTLYDESGAHLNLPYDIPANQYMNIAGRQFSKSRNWAVWLPDFLSRYDPDALRYYLSVTMPETRDTDYNWDEFVRRNNDELVAAWGNLVNRILTFAYKHFDGRVPEPGPYGDDDRAILARVEAGFESVGALFAACKFRAALGEAMALVDAANRYIDKQGPWFQIKSDRARAATTVYVTLRVVDSLKILLAPFLPFTAERLHQYLGYDAPLFGTLHIEHYTEREREHDVLVYDPAGATGRWTPSTLAPGQAMRQPQALFKKLEPSVADEELARLGQ
jgi:methionyl-tRNA synthetase